MRSGFLLNELLLQPEVELLVNNEKRVILKVYFIFILSSSKNDVTIKIIVWSKFNNDQLQIQR